jgi:hypothetical protein
LLDHGATACHNQLIVGQLPLACAFDDSDSYKGAGFSRSGRDMAAHFIKNTSHIGYHFGIEIVHRYSPHTFVKVADARNTFGSVLDIEKYFCASEQFLKRRPASHLGAPIFISTRH